MAPAATVGAMAHVDAGARQDLLDAVAGATEQIGIALAALGAAYEAVDEPTGDRLEEQLFGPAQTAYGRAKRTYAGFAERHGLPPRQFPPADQLSSSRGVKPLVERAVDAITTADLALGGLQDSMLPVEYGDRELREGLADVREHLGAVTRHARDFVRTLGR